MSNLRGEGVRVLLVGTGSHVAGSMLPDIHAVPATVQALHDLLISLCGVRDENLTALLDPEGPEHFLDKVLEAASSATDVLLIYYIGHGALNPTGELYLATRATVDLRRKAAYQALP